VREVELKAVVADVLAARARVEAAGGVLRFAGAMEDRRYDTPPRRLAAEDEVLRVRVYRAPTPGAPTETTLDWKGPTTTERGYKVREELSTSVADPELLVAILDRLGFVVTRRIDRVIAQYALAGAILRFEQYPRMDVLLEVEGEPEAIDRAIAAAGLARADFSADGLPDFVARYEARTGLRAALAWRDLDV